MQPKAYLQRITSNLSNVRELYENGNFPIAISTLNRSNPTKVRAVLIQYIGQMLKYFGRQEDMDDAQVNALCSDIMEEYYYLSFEEIILCFRDVRMHPNSYEKIYRQISPATFMSWLQTFVRKRNEELKSVKPYTEEETDNAENTMSRDEYEECLLARAAGGDSEASAALRQMKRVALHYFKNRHSYGNYKYWRKHKYDER